LVLQRETTTCLPVCARYEQAWQGRQLGCCMRLGETPESHDEALKADLLEVCTAAAQGGHQQLVEVLSQCGVGCGVRWGRRS
jgi:hypothetical protein